MSSTHKLARRHFMVGGGFVTIAAGILIVVITSGGGPTKSGKAQSITGRQAATVLPPGCDRVPKGAQAECAVLSTGVTNLPAPNNLPPGYTSNEKSPNVASPAASPAPIHDVVQAFTGPAYIGAYEHIGEEGFDISQTAPPEQCSVPNYCNGSTLVDGVPNSFVLTGTWSTVISNTLYLIASGAETSLPNQGVVIEKTETFPSKPPQRGQYSDAMVTVRTTSKMDGTLTVVSGSDSAGTVALKAADGAIYSYNFLTQTISSS